MANCNKLFTAIYFFTLAYLLSQVQGQRDLLSNGIESGSDNADSGKEDNPKENWYPRSKEDCWMNLNAAQLFNTMERLDDEYEEVRKKFQQAVKSKEFDAKMLDVMLKLRGMSDRAVQLAGDPSYIPAGLNLGGHFMMRMADSVLFFHRLKLRNDTRFRINQLKNNFELMILTARLSLNNLHFVGTYERTITDRDPSILYYTPTFGQVEFLLKDVSYKMEGRYRLLEDKLYLEMVLSKVTVNGGILMMYSNQTSHNERKSLNQKNIEDFLERVKSGLDDWLLDYFNDYFIFLDFAGIKNNDKFQHYDKKKTLALNDYFDSALTVIRRRLRKLNATSVKLPNFSIYSESSRQLKLKEGLLYGLDSIYRRSLATGSKKGNIRDVDAIVGFSSLKVVYKYEAVLTTSTPALSGILVLSADELTAHLGLSLVKQPETVDLTIDCIRQMKPDSLIVEGSANTMTANFKHLLELHINAIMTNSLLFQIKLLTTLTRCTPNLVSHADRNNMHYQELEEDYLSYVEESETSDECETNEVEEYYNDTSESTDTDVDEGSSYTDKENNSNSTE